MVKFVDTVFLLFMAIALIAIAGIATFPQDAGLQDWVIVGVASALATATYCLRNPVRRRFGRFGLLTYSGVLTYRNRKPFTPQERKNAIASWAAMTATLVLSESQRKTDGKNNPALVVIKEIAEISKHWRGKVPSDDEIRTRQQLFAFAETDNQNRDTIPTEHLKDVRDTATFYAVRAKVDAIYAERDRAKEAYQAWQEHVGDLDMDHLVADGWIPFLEGLPGPDINLWNGIATDFHEMMEDRLAAAFWIVAQKDCDKATVSDFIRSYIEFELETRLKSGQHEMVSRFFDIVEAYSTGYYPYHSITAGIFSSATPSDDEINRMLKKVEDTFELSPLPRPIGLVGADTPTTSPRGRGYNSPYAFWDDAGLHLEYPGENWRNAA